MFASLKKVIKKSRFYPSLKEKGSEEAYDLWSENYDSQPGNLMLELDEQVFSGLLKGVVLKNKQVADIGCGTGRHWAKLLKEEPQNLTGFDVSSGMLNRLQEKFPEASVSRITDNLFSATADAAYDVIISTLTVAHIQDIAEALQAWSRILKKEGDIIITDFHPDALAFGGKRTFEHDKTQMAVRNFVHGVADIKKILAQHGFYVVKIAERIVDEPVKHYYTAKNALHVYEKFKDSKIIYGIHLKRDSNYIKGQQ